MAEVESLRPDRAELDHGTTVALGMAFTSFVIPVIPAVVAIVVGATTKRRLRAGGGNRTNEGLASLAQLSALFTLALHGGFALWVALS